MSAPNAKPPICAQYATPPVLTWPRAPTPLNSCRTNHIPRTTAAGSETKVMMKKKTNVSTFRRGNITRYAPSTPAIAPDAPRFGITLFGPTAISAALATMPATR
jgi:hypothetical protein